MMNHGWECPKCHRCYAPMQMYCMTCNANPVTETDIKVTTTELATLADMVETHQQRYKDMIDAEKQLNDWRNKSSGYLSTNDPMSTQYVPRYFEDSLNDVLNKSGQSR
jgi:hypothetical protein